MSIQDGTLSEDLKDFRILTPEDSCEKVRITANESNQAY